MHPGLKLVVQQDQQDDTLQRPAVVDLVNAPVVETRAFPCMALRARCASCRIVRHCRSGLASSGYMATGWKPEAREEAVPSTWLISEDEGIAATHRDVYFRAFAQSYRDPTKGKVGEIEADDDGAADLSLEREDHGRRA